MTDRHALAIDPTALAQWLADHDLPGYRGKQVIDWLYRRLGSWISRGLNDGAEQAWDRFMARADATLSKVNSGLYRFHGPDGIFGRTWPTGQMAFWTTVMLGAYVLLSYV